QRPGHRTAHRGQAQSPLQSPIAPGLKPRNLSPCPAPTGQAVVPRLNANLGIIGVEDHLVVAYIRRTLSRPMHAAGSPLRLRTGTALPPPKTGMYMSRWPTGSTTSLTAVPSSSCSVVAGPEYESWMIQA